MISLTVVVPVYNAANSLAVLAERLETTLNGAGLDYEVLFVDDGSRDESWGKIQALGARNPRLKGVTLMRNYGQHNALLCGIRSAQGEVVVTMDDDLQHRPEDIPKLLEKLSEGHDVVYGTPLGERHEFWRNLASVVTKLVLRKSLGSDAAGRISAFRAFRTHLRDAFASYHGAFVNIDVLLSWGGTRFSFVAVEHERRAAGESNYTFYMLVTHAFNMVTGYSVMPLQFASLAGFLFTLFGLGILAYVLVSYLVQGTTVPGFPFLASVIAIFSGAQLFALGIMGEYLARMNFRMMDRPAYTVRGKTNHG
ncbi:MAG: glycosyltransferase family 2 protein [Elusimicrobiota bacterium]